MAKENTKIKPVLDFFRNYWSPLFWGGFLSVLFYRYIFETPDGLYVGHEHAWSDWPLHLSMVRIFSTKQPSEWFAYHPMYAEGKLVYTFLTNLISALFLRMGFSLTLSFIIPSIALSWGLVMGLHTLWRKLYGDIRVAQLAMAIFFMAAGLGFLEFFKDFLASRNLALFFYPPKHYSRFDEFSWYAGNFIVGHFGPQRSSLLGGCLGLWGILGVFDFNQVAQTTARKWRSLIQVIFCLGILPIAHMHSLFACAFILAAFVSMSLRQWKTHLQWALPSAATAVGVYIIFLSGGMNTSSFLKWNPGFTAHTLLEFLRFWGWEWGLMLPLALWGMVATVRGDKPIERKALIIGGWIIFSVANLILFQPVAWDNSKLFLWAYLAFSGAVGHLLISLWDKRGLKKVFSIGLVFFLCMTGVLELIRIQRIDLNKLQVLSRSEITLGERIRKETPPLARFLTNTDHNHFIMSEAARPILMGFTPWVANFGFNPGNLESEMGEMFTGSPRALELLEKHNISYVVIGPGEISHFHANMKYFEKKYPIAFSNGGITIFNVKAPLPSAKTQ